MKETTEKYPVEETVKKSAGEKLMPDLLKMNDKINILVKEILKKKEEGIINVAKDGDLYKIEVEVLERKSVPDTQDLLCTYMFELNENLYCVRYKRMKMRHRGDKVEESE